MNDEIFRMSQLQQLVRAGVTDWKAFGDVAVQEADGLLLFNYTPMAQINGRWNWFETVSRGLILARETGEVVARPFDKFFNWGEGGRMPAPGAALVRVVEKCDGSLGIAYMWRGDAHVTTRGSRFSPQAQWATEWLRTNRGPALSNWTFLFEIIYPENRIVVDYGGWSGLVLLAARNNCTGAYMDEQDLDAWAKGHNLRRPKTFTFNSPEEIVAAAATLKDAEGWVALFSDGSRFKIKGDEYKQLHKLVSGLNFQSVLEAVKTDSADALMAKLPPGPLRWQAEAWRQDIEVDTHIVMRDVASYMRHIPPAIERREFAARVSEMPSWIRPHLFAAYDHKPLRPAILKTHFRDRRDRLMGSADA